MYFHACFINKRKVVKWPWQKTSPTQLYSDAVWFSVGSSRPFVFTSKWPGYYALMIQSRQPHDQRPRQPVHKRFHFFFHPLFLLDPCKKSIDIFLSCISWNVLAFKVIMWHFFVVFAGKQRNSHNRATLTFKMKSASLASQIFEFATTSFYGIHTYWSSLKGSQAPSALLY